MSQAIESLNVLGQFRNSRYRIRHLNCSISSGTESFFKRRLKMGLLRGLSSGGFETSTSTSILVPTLHLQMFPPPLAITTGFFVTHLHVHHAVSELDTSYSRRLFPRYPWTYYLARPQPLPLYSMHLQLYQLQLVST